MGAGGVDVQLGRHAGAAEGKIKLYGVLRRHGFVPVRVKEKRGRGLRRHLLLARQASHQCRVGVFSQQVFLGAAIRVWLARAMTA